MLRSLSIRNYALIEELAVDFGNGLVILTGETGAGKSIIIDALSLILGERASTDLVRSGAEKAVVEGVFHIAGNKKLMYFLERQELERTEELIARREITTRGQSRCFINDSPVTASLLKQVGEFLVDLHGQHEHQSLLHAEYHGDMLDEFGGLGALVEEFRQSYRKLKESADQLAALRHREQQLREKREFYEFQLQEINAVDPQPGEDEDLEREVRILENAEKLFEATSDIYQKLYEGENSVHDLLVVVRNRLQDLGRIDTRFDEAAGETETAVAVVSELAKFIQGYNARIEFQPDQLERFRERLGRLSHLKKKYGGALDQVIAHRDALAREVSLVEGFDTVTQNLLRELEETRKACGTIGQRLSAKRGETARKLDKAIVAELATLGIPHGKFSTRIEQTEIGTQIGGNASGELYAVSGKKRVVLNERGVDTVEFYVSTNLGEEVRPLARVASGGEISRIMLALKSILAKSDRLPVLIFDEIDVGVSGRIAQAVGLSLKSLSKFHQVVAITHLPQIAGVADAHYLVYKSEEGGRATTSIRRLTDEERVLEVATLMSGAEVTATGLEGARELMGLK
jgi:DNA repair protein RecN (Recombination protein N)